MAHAESSVTREVVLDPEYSVADYTSNQIDDVVSAPEGVSNGTKQLIKKNTPKYHAQIHRTASVVKSKDTKINDHHQPVAAHSDAKAEHHQGTASHDTAANATHHKDEALINDPNIHNKTSNESEAEAESTANETITEETSQEQEKEKEKPSVVDVTAMSDEEQEKYFKTQQAHDHLNKQAKEIAASIDILKKKQKNLEIQMSDPLNPNLAEINFSLVNQTNHIVIDLQIREADDRHNINGAPQWAREKANHQITPTNGYRMPRYDANQQAVQCMLQNISYVCIGKSLRKCCSIEAVSDDQCENTERYYHGVRLDDVEELSAVDREFQGKAAEYIDDRIPLGRKKTVTGDEEDPDEDIDPDTILNHQKFPDITFDKSQILKREGPLVHPNDVLCSDTLRDRISFYSQFELAPTFTEVCGQRYINASLAEVYMRSQDLIGVYADPAIFSKYSMCMYEVYNPYPKHTLYVNLYRQTNNSDIGIYFEESKRGLQSVAKKSPLLPKGYKEKVHEYMAGEWKLNTSIPIETQDQMNRFHTFKVQYPPRRDLFFDMSRHMKRVGGEYHNVSDVLRQYAFEGVDKINIVVIGQSEFSQFDIGVQVSLFPTTINHLFQDHWGYFALGLFCLLALYLVILSIMYGVKSRKGYHEF